MKISRNIALALLVAFLAAGCLGTGDKKPETIKMPESVINKSDAPEFPDELGLSQDALSKITPPAPLNFKGVASGANVVLSWEPATEFPSNRQYSTTITEFIIYRRPPDPSSGVADDGEFKRLVQVKVLGGEGDFSYTDKSVAPGNTYEYQISQVHDSKGDRGAEGERTDPIKVKTF